MTLDNLFTRVVETTGLDVVTVDSLGTAIANCFADLTSRGYRNFRELIYSNSTIKQEYGMATVKIPKKLRKSLYFRIQFEKGVAVASRISISNPRIQSLVKPEGFRTPLHETEVIYYIKGTDIIIEWNQERYGNICQIFYGYYEKLTMPTIPKDQEGLEHILLDIREEFEDVVVLYCVYFFYQRALKDDQKIQIALNNYKYMVEDLLHELAYEDTYNDEDVVIGEEY